MFKLSAESLSDDASCEENWTRRDSLVFFILKYLTRHSNNVAPHALSRKEGEIPALKNSKELCGCAIRYPVEV